MEENKVGEEEGPPEHLYKMPDFSEHPEILLFEGCREQKTKELEDVLRYLIEAKEMEMTKAIKYDKAIEYFRGVDFHLLVLSNKEEVLGMLPSFVKDRSLHSLDSIDDSMKLGQFMVYTQLIQVVFKHPNLIV